MREIKPHEAGRGLCGVAHQMMVISPNDSNEKIADSVTEPSWPQRQERREGRSFRRTQIQNEDSDKDGENSVGECIQPFWSSSGMWHGCFPPARPNLPAEISRAWVSLPSD